MLYREDIHSYDSFIWWMGGLVLGLYWVGSLSYVCNPLCHPGHEHVWGFGHGCCSWKGRRNVHTHLPIWAQGDLTHDKASKWTCMLDSSMTMKTVCELVLIHSLISPCLFFNLQVHFFNSFFYDKLRTKGYDGVKRWTKNVSTGERWGRTLSFISLLLILTHFRTVKISWTCLF